MNDLNKVFDFYFEYTDFIDKMRKMYNYMYNQKWYLMREWQEHELRGIYFRERLQYIESVISRILKIKHDWIKRHNERLEI